MLDEFVCHPSDVYLRYSLGPARQDAGPVQRHTQMRGLGPEEPAGEVAQTGRLGLGSVQDELDVLRAR